VYYYFVLQPAQIQPTELPEAQVNPSVSKKRDAMKSKAQSASLRGSVETYVTKWVAGWNAAPRACRFQPSKVRFLKLIFCEDLKEFINFHNTLYFEDIW
jgi:hypothetical protein